MIFRFLTGSIKTPLFSWPCYDVEANIPFLSKSSFNCVTNKKWKNVNTAASSPILFNRKDSSAPDCLFCFDTQLLEIARCISHCDDMHFFLFLQYTIYNGIIFIKQLSVSLICIGTYTPNCSTLRRTFQAENCILQLVNHFRSCDRF